MNKINYNKIVAELECWFDSWRDKEGRYNGPVIHRRDLKRLKDIHDTPWSQAEVINAYLNIYSITEKREYLDKAIIAAKAQISNILDTGEYRYAGYEDDRFSSLVHNALADCALLNLAKLLKNRNILCDLKDEIIITVQKNIKEYFINCLYVPAIGAFKFNHVDYYSLDENRCVCNMNAIAAEAMIKLEELTGDISLSKYINSVGTWLKKYVNFSKSIDCGAISYSHTQEHVYISIYTALALRGICCIYEYNKDEELLKIIKKSTENLVGFMDNDMFMHESNNGKIYSKPWFVSGSGMIFSAIRSANSYMELKIDEEKYLIPFMKYQLSNGAFQNYIGYNSCGNRLTRKKDGCEVWEDVFPTIGWNAQMFAYLSNYVTKEYKSISETKNNLIVRWNYFYYENSKKSYILSWYPLRSIALLKYSKKKNKAQIAFSLLDFTRKLRGLR